MLDFLLSVRDSAPAIHLIVFGPSVVERENESFAQNAFNPQRDEEARVNTEVSVVSMVVTVGVVEYVARDKVSAKCGPGETDAAENVVNRRQILVS